jgi:hypothetical protein
LPIHFRNSPPSKLSTSTTLPGSSNGPPNHSPCDARSSARVFDAVTTSHQTGARK